VTLETSAAAAKVPTAVLSTTARAREKAKKKEAERSSKADADKAVPSSSGLQFLKPRKTAMQAFRALLSALRGLQSLY
jgi:hypothetical protein